MTKHFTPTTTFNSQMRDQLEAVQKTNQLTVRKTEDKPETEKKPMHKSKSSKPFNKDKQYPTSDFNLFKPMKPPVGKDGVDHILIGKRGVTKLGKLLDTYSFIEVKHSHFGEFKNLDRFRAYVTSVNRDDRIRYMPDAEYLSFSSHLIYKGHHNFNAIMLDAIYQRVLKNPDLLEEMKLSTLPFEIYKENEFKVKIRSKSFYWMLPGMEEVRKAIKGNRLPNLNAFRRDKGVGDLFAGLIEPSEPTLVTLPEVDVEPKPVVTKRGAQVSCVVMDESGIVSDIPQQEIVPVDDTTQVEVTQETIPEPTVSQ